MSVRVLSTMAGLATATMLLLVIVGCGSTTETVPIPQESAAEALQSELESAGLNVAWLAASQRSDFFDSDVRRATLQIDDAEGFLINLYRFPNAEEAAAPLVPSVQAAARCRRMVVSPWSRGAADRTSSVRVG